MAKNGHNLPAKMGRPTKYTKELVCLELAEGASVHQLCKRPEYPSEDTIYRWLNEREDFSEKYRMAREFAADRLADEVVAIADGDLPVLNEVDGVQLNLDTAVRVSRDNARIKARIWKAGRMSPRKWGELVNEQANVAAPPKAIIIVKRATTARAVGQADRRGEHDSD
jgi:Bacteriophage Sf6, terminase small subunit-like